MLVPLSAVAIFGVREDVPCMYRLPCRKILERLPFRFRCASVSVMYGRLAFGSRRKYSILPRTTLAAPFDQKDQPVPVSDAPSIVREPVSIRPRTVRIPSASSYLT